MQVAGALEKHKNAQTYAMASGTAWVCVGLALQSPAFPPIELYLWAIRDECNAKNALNLSETGYFRSAAVFAASMMQKSRPCAASLAGPKWSVRNPVLKIRLCYPNDLSARAPT
jgi:hypothetical protein